MFTILVLLSLTLLALLFMFSVPVDIRFWLQKEERPETRLGVEWLFGLLKREWILPRTRKRPKTELDSGPGHSQRGNRRNRLRPILAAVRQKGFPKAVLKLLSDALSVMIVRDFQLNLRFGLDDPADTGCLFAWISAPLALVRSYPSLHIGVEPDFSGEKLNVRLKGSVRVIPLQFVGVLVPFIVSPPTLRAIRTAIIASRR